MNCPKIGFGTYRLFNDLKLGVGKFYYAIERGYKLIDTAEHYNNQKIIGKLIYKMRVPRSEVFLVSKVWRNNLDYKSTITSVNKMLNELQTNYIDCVLIHWPNPIYNIVETLGALQEQATKGFINKYGVSNFTINDIKNAQSKGFNSISYNQIEFHPLLHQKELLNYCTQNNISVMSHSSLAGGKALENNVIKSIANKNNITPAQVVYAWLINKKIIPITGLGTGEQILQNINVLNLNLPVGDLQKLDKLNENYRSLNKEYSLFK